MTRQAGLKMIYFRVSQTMRLRFNQLASTTALAIVLLVAGCTSRATSKRNENGFTTVMYAQEHSPAAEAEVRSRALRVMAEDPNVSKTDAYAQAGSGDSDSGDAEPPRTKRQREKAEAQAEFEKDLAEQFGK
jgi:hypothetical protein